jgi:hypothetical protein
MEVKLFTWSILALITPGFMYYVLCTNDLVYSRYVLCTLVPAMACMFMHYVKGAMCSRSTGLMVCWFGPDARDAEPSSASSLPSSPHHNYSMYLQTMYTSRLFLPSTKFVRFTSFSES